MQSNTLRVTDHKTGRALPSRPQQLERCQFFSPCYMLWQPRTLLGQTVECGSLYFCTQRGDFPR